MNPRCVAFEQDQLARAVPLANGTSRWIRFNLLFKRELLDSRGWGVTTDISGYFEYIRHSRLVQQVANTPGVRKSEPAVLRHLLRAFAIQGEGLPQNNDCSSLLGNYYLTEIDNISRPLRERYIRYGDDIRIVAKSRAEAVESFARIQKSLRPFGLVINSSKTVLLVPGSQEWTDRTEAKREKLLGEIDALIKRAQTPGVNASKLGTKLSAKLEIGLASATGARDWRAFGLRLIRARALLSLSPKLEAAVERTAMRGFFSVPEGADIWARLLRPIDVERKVARLLALLESRDFNQDAWVNTKILEWIGQSKISNGRVVDALRDQANVETNHWTERCAAHLALSRLGAGSPEITKLLVAVPNDQVARTAALVGRSLPPRARARVWDFADAASPFAKYAIDFLRGGEFQDTSTEPEVSAPQEVVVGQIDGKPEHFLAPIAGDDYE